LPPFKQGETYALTEESLPLVEGLTSPPAHLSEGSFTTSLLALLLLALLPLVEGLTSPPAHLSEGSFTTSLLALLLLALLPLVECLTSQLVA
jgi:hypothetical protein